MDSRRYLTEQIRKCRRKLNIAKILDSGILFAAAGGIFGIFCEVWSLIRPFYHAHLAAGICFAAGFAAGIGCAVYRRADMRRAAGKLDSFGLKERMITAWEQIDSEKEFAVLQREDAVRHYDRIREQIKIPLLPDKRHLCAFLLAAAVTGALCLVPSPVREQAELLHEVREQAEEEKEKLEELLEAMEKIDMESLTEEERAQLQELLEAMKLSGEELERADSWESLDTALEKLDYKYGQTAQSLASLASQTENQENAGLAAAQAFAKAAANKRGQQTASSGTAGSGDGGEKQEGSGEDGEGDGDGSGEGSGQGSGQGQGSGSGGEGQGQGSGNGDGQGDGSGGEGSGQGFGQGQGNGNAPGRGTGSSNAERDYVSVPNGVGNDASLTGDKSGDQDSEYYRRQNGLAWEGEHVDYDTVIGEYTDNAYEGIATGKYPNGMESVIRDYFESLNKPGSQ
ncbi:MAG: hypothetical protein NC541_07425 [bacterium]|nr:hypothetical protein [bacterium]